MSGNDFLGAFYEKPQKPYGFSWLEGVQTGQRCTLRGLQPGQRLKIRARRAQTRTHFIRSIAPRVLISPSITLVSVLSGIRQNPSVQALFWEYQHGWATPNYRGVKRHKFDISLKHFWAVKTLMEGKF